jgi:hypothetical protein
LRNLIIVIFIIIVCCCLVALSIYRLASLESLSVKVSLKSGCMGKRGEKKQYKCQDVSPTTNIQTTTTTSDDNQHIRVARFSLSCPRDESTSTDASVRLLLLLLLLMMMMMLKIAELYLQLVLLRLRVRQRQLRLGQLPLCRVVFCCVLGG